jgi:hypothetical protein
MGGRPVTRVRHRQRSQDGNHLPANITDPTDPDYDEITPLFSPNEDVRVVAESINVNGDTITHFSGLVGTVEAVFTEPDDKHDWEVLPMYLVRFTGDVQGTAEFFEDELEDL